MCKFDELCCCWCCNFIGSVVRKVDVPEFVGVEVARAMKDGNALCIVDCHVSFGELGCAVLVAKLADGDEVAGKTVEQFDFVVLWCECGDGEFGSMRVGCNGRIRHCYWNMLWIEVDIVVSLIMQ